MVSPLDVKAMTTALRKEADVFVRQAFQAPNGFTAELDDATGELLGKAADLITAQAARIAELEEERDEALEGKRNFANEVAKLRLALGDDWPVKKARALSKEQADG